MGGDEEGARRGEGVCNEERRKERHEIRLMVKLRELELPRLLSHALNFLLVRRQVFVA